MSRILLFTSQYEGVFGSTRSMIQLVKVLDENPEHECVVLTTGRGKLIGLLESENLKYHTIPLGRFSSLTGGKLRPYGWRGKIRAAFEILRFQIQVFRYIRRNRFNIVYANNPGSFFRIYLAARLNRCRTVTYIRSAVQNDAVTRLTIRKSRQIITIADGLLRELPSSLVAANSDRIRTIYTGFDFDSFDYKTRIEGLSPDKVKVGYVASLTQRKGIDFLIRLFLENPEIAERAQLVIAGGYSHGHEDYRAAMERLFAQMDEAGIDYIHLGFQGNVHAMYNSIDVLALPSLSEGLPRVVIEAMAHGCAVIANDVG
ncbi:MAG: glycosyltransferase family 4 protein, partial [Spirochaetaceae bacterium]|nr:glycosyltransferase family 4 protein [Spirochaetaceae bacterium]